MKVLFIGAGNMGSAIIGGMIKKNITRPEDIYIFEVNNETKKRVLKKFKVNELSVINGEISTFDIIILAVKPQIFNSFYDNQQMSILKDFADKKQLVISIMAGITIAKITAFFHKCPVVRIMPNTPVLIGKGISAISSSNNVSIEQIENVKQIFSAIGKTIVLEEKYMDAVTALSGSGPAYVYTFIEALVQGGVLCGLSKEISERLVIEMIYGSILMIDEKKKVEELRHAVTSPAGTTIEALAVLEKNNFRYSLIEAVRAAQKRAGELSK